MADDREELRDWHRLFGLLLMDFFTGSPFVVEVKRDLSVQQQLLDGKEKRTFVISQAEKDECPAL